MTLNRATESETRVRRALQGLTGRGKANVAGVMKLTGGMEMYEAGDYPLWIVDKATGKNFLYMWRGTTDGNPTFGIIDKDGVIGFEANTEREYNTARGTLRLVKTTTPWDYPNLGEAMLDAMYETPGGDTALTVTFNGGEPGAEVGAVPSWAIPYHGLPDYALPFAVGSPTSEPNVTLELARSNRLVAKIVRDVSTTYTVSPFDYIIVADPTSAGFTIHLPQVSTLPDHEIVIKYYGSSGNTVTLDGYGSETIDGAATLAINTAWTKVRLLSRENDNGWYTI